MISLFATTLFAENFTIKIEVLDGEKWYGAATARGHLMPFSDGMDVIDLNKRHFSNQAAPFLVSSRGRYVWSEKPFAFAIKDGVLNLTSKFEQISLVSAGDNLKEAYLLASRKHFPADGKIPPEEFFRKPQFNTWIEMMYNQNQVGIENYVRAISENKFPCGVLMVDGGWDRYYGMLDFRKDRFSDVKKLNKMIHDMGYKVIYWVGPFVGSAGLEFLNMEKGGVLLQDKTKGKRRGCSDFRAYCSITVF